MRTLTLLISVLLASMAGFGQAISQPVLEFVASGNTRAHDEFTLGVIALHSSAYTDAADHSLNADCCHAGVPPPAPQQPPLPLSDSNAMQRVVQDPFPRDSAKSLGVQNQSANHPGMSPESRHLRS